MHVGRHAAIALCLGAKGHRSRLKCPREFFGFLTVLVDEAKSSPTLAMRIMLAQQSCR